MNRKEYKGYLVDLDGTMYKGKQRIEEAAPFINRLKDKDIPYIFVTNNSTSSPEEVAKKLINDFDVPAKASEVYTSSLATADYLKTLEGNRVLVVGEKGLVEALTHAGFELTNDNPDHVVVGLDRDLSYEKMVQATLAIQKGASFIATNKDTNLPTERGLVPGAGSLVALLETATKTPPTFVGKPEAIMMEGAVQRINLAKEDVLMVGDNYETDILAGINNGIDTLLVLTGFTSRKDLEAVKEQPNYIVETLDDWEE